MSRSVLLRMRYFQAKLVEKLKIHILCLVFFFFFENCAFYEILKNIAEPDRAQIIV